MHSEEFSGIGIDFLLFSTIIVVVVRENFHSLAYFLLVSREEKKERRDVICSRFFHVASGWKSRFFTLFPGRKSEVSGPVGLGFVYTKGFPVVKPSLFSSTTLLQYNTHFASTSSGVIEAVQPGNDSIHNTRSRCHVFVKILRGILVEENDVLHTIHIQYYMYIICVIIYIYT